MSADFEKIFSQSIRHHRRIDMTSEHVIPREWMTPAFCFNRLIRILYVIRGLIKYIFKCAGTFKYLKGQKRKLRFDQVVGNMLDGVQKGVREDDISRIRKALGADFR